MKKARGLLAVLLLSAAGGGGCSSGSDSPGDGAGAAVCAWNARPPELTLPVSEVRGVLRGASRNASTTCTRQKGTGGPEAIHTLRVTERSLVELEALSALDTVIAVRRACDDPLTELACSDTPLGGDPGIPGGSSRPVDASPSPPPFAIPDGAAAALLPQIVSGNARDARLRVVLDPGIYYVVVDEAEPFGVGGDYVLKVSTFPPLAQASCQTAHPVKDGVSLPVEELDLGTELAPACTGDGRRPALYYRATIPSGQRLTVRAQALAGDRPWSPVLQLLAACGQSACLATDLAGTDGVQRVLRYVNNGPGDQPVTFSLGANTAVSGAAARLDVSIGEPQPNGTCASARPVSDGEILRNQDLSQGQNIGDSPCHPVGASSLFYSATLLPLQSLRFTMSRQGAPLFGGVQLLLREACNDILCRSSMGDRVEYTNSGTSARTVIVEAAGSPESGPTTFDLHVSIPPPSAAMFVAPRQGLQTSEAGGRASFTVVIASPPLQPVIIPLLSSDAAEGTVSPAQIVFDRDNWQTPQTVTVTGADDGAKDGARAYQVQVGPATGADVRYTALPATRVSLLNRDDEAGFYLVARTPLHTTESGGKATFTVVLDRAPTAAVHLPLRSNDEGEGTVAPAELVWEPETWNQPRTVTVTGADDPGADGAQTYRVLTGPAASDDPQYAGIDPPDLDARNADDEYQRVAAQVVSGDLSCQVGEAGPGIAADQNGALYVAMACHRPSGQTAASPGATGAGVDEGAAAPLPPPTPSLFVATSADGGRTFGPPVYTGVDAYDAHVAGGPPGVVLAAGTSPEGVVFVRSDDGGTTWSAPRLLVSTVAGPRLAASGNTVVVGVATERPTPLISEDGGLTFLDTLLPVGLLGVGVDRDTGVVWMMTFDGRVMFQQSADSGLSFGGGLVVSDRNQAFIDAFAVSATTIFAVGELRLLVQARDGSSRREVGGLASDALIPRALACDDTDTAFVLENLNHTVQVRRLPAGADAFQPARALGPSSAPPALVALADNAIAVSLSLSGQVLVAVETWP